MRKNDCELSSSWSLPAIEVELRGMETDLSLLKIILGTFIIWANARYFYFSYGFSIGDIAKDGRRPTSDASLLRGVLSTLGTFLVISCFGNSRASMRVILCMTKWHKCYTDKLLKPLG